MDAGNTDQISLKKETTYGTAVVPDVSIIIRESDGINIEHSPVEVEGLKGTSPRIKSTAQGIYDYPGSFELNAYPIGIGYFIFGSYGSEATPATVESGVYRHTFTEICLKPGFTVEEKLGSAISKRFAGYCMSGFKLSCKVGEAIILACGGMGKAQATAGPITGAYETTLAFDFTDITTLTVAGVSLLNSVDSIEIEYTNGLNTFHGIGSTDPSNRYSATSEVKGKFTGVVDTATLNFLTNLIAGTEVEIIINIVADETIGAVSKNELKLTLSKCQVQKYSTKLSYDYNAVTIEFEAREDATNGIMKTELQNTLAAY